MANLIVANIPAQSRRFDAAYLMQLIGTGPHRLVPESCCEATIMVNPDDIVKIVLVCNCDLETIRELAPDIADQLMNQSDFVSQDRMGNRIFPNRT